MGTRIAGIQPGYLPWLGYFDQMLQVDAFLIADELQFTTSGWAHRNRVRGPHGAHWLTIPTRPRKGQTIAEVEIERSAPWHKTHLRTLRHFYSASAHARDALDEIAAVIAPDARLLVEASIPTIRHLAERLGVATPILRSSDLGLEARYRAEFPEAPSATHRIIAYLKALGADELLEGEAGNAYLDLELCARHGVRVRFHHYRHPVYPQMFEPFVSHLSAVDLLLACGAHEARRVLRSVQAEVV